MERNMRDPQQVRTQNAQQPLPEQAVILAAQEAARARESAGASRTGYQRRSGTAGGASA